MNRMFLAVVSCLPLLLTAHNVQSVELVGPNEEPQSIQSLNSVASSNSTSPSSVSRYGPVSVNETLWSISNKLRPNTDVSVYQTLVAIYKANPTAFRNGDINRIIVTSVIDVPSLSFISQQTNAEAFRLLRITNTPTPKPSTPVATKQDSASVEDQETKEKEQQALVESQKVEQLSNEKLKKLEAEYALLNEQLILATESNQRLKLKLQPLSDQINNLSDQVEEDINVQIELQALIDQYKAQIDAFEEPPFSGPGLLNKILSSITNSASTLLLTILSPLLLLTALFLLILRIKSKRELALKEQELAESTAIMDEEENEFDSLFASDIGTEEVTEETAETTEEEDALTIIEEELANSNVLTDTYGAETDLIDGEDDSSTDDSIDTDTVINGDDEVIELSESDLALNEDISQNDLDLAAQWESELAELEEKEEEQVDLDDFQFDTPEDTPLEPIQLDDVEPVTTIEEDSSPEVIPEVEGLLDEEPVEKVIEKDDSLATDDADIDDLLAESDIEVAEDSSLEAVPEIEGLSDKESDQTVTEKEESIADNTDIDGLLDESVIEVEEDSSPETIPEVDELSDEQPVEPAIEDEEFVADSTDIDEILTEESSELENSLTETAAKDEELDVEIESMSEVDSDTETEQVVSADSQTSTDELLAETEVNSDEDTFESTNDIEPELSDERKEAAESKKNEEPSVVEADNEDENVPTKPETSEVDEALDFSDPDTLAKQLSSNAFNEDAELPKFDKADGKGFIDIDTLLANEEGQELNEEEFDLDFGLDEFPDVVESFAEFDTDADGVAAQLDLARAYLEIDEKEGAKTILTQLMETAPEDKLKEVKKLYDRIS